MFTRHLGQRSILSVATSSRAIAAPQWEQNFAPTNTIPKQDGHATVANRAPQCPQEVASEATGAPHEGQFMASGVFIVCWLMLYGEFAELPMLDRRFVIIRPETFGWSRI
jgi:hypothetical protein